MSIMKRKKNNLARAAMTLLLAVVCAVSYAQTTTIKYTATEKIARFEEIQYFTGATALQSHTFDTGTGEGTVVYAGTVTALDKQCMYQTNTLTSIVIPASVTAIEEYAFSRCEKLTTVTIPEGVTKIGFCAFEHSGLTSLTLPSTITSMSQSFYGCPDLATLTLTPGITTLGQSFYNCPKLTTVNIPGSVKEIGSSDFSSCTGLTTVVLNEGTEKIEFSGCTNLKTINFPSTTKEIYFKNCSSLETVTLPEGVTRISSFDGCSELKQINIPKSVTYVGWFRYCNKLEKVIIADVASWCNVRHYDAEHYGPTLKAGKLYLGTVDNYEEIINLVIPEGVTKIKSSSFNGLPNIKTVTIPSTLTSWEWKAFDGCTGITDAWCLADPIALDWSESSTNFAAEKATQMHVLDADLWSSKFPDANATFVGDLTQVPYTATAAVSAFGADKFPGATAMLLNSFDAETGKGYAIFRGNLTAVAGNAFAGSTSLTSITLPDGIATIGANAFNGCTALATITLPKTVTTFSANAFAGLANTTDVWCVADPEALTWDGTGFKDGKQTVMHVMVADDWTTKFPDANVTFQGDMTRFRYTATGKDTQSFYNLDNFVGAEEMASHDYNTETGEGSVIFKGIVTGLKYRTFYRNDLLTSMVIPTTVTEMKDYIFNECSNLTTVSLPNTITSMGGSNFSRCTSLTTVNIPTSLTAIPGGTFYKCSSLANIDIPESITDIESYAFASCTGLTSIFIPAAVTQIRSHAFENSTNIVKVITPDIAAWCAIDYSGGNADSNPLCHAKHLYVGSKESNTEVTDLVIPDGVTEVKRLTFYNCEGLTSITIPTTVTTIGNWGYNPFHGCTNIANIYCLAVPFAKWEGDGDTEAFMPEKATKMHVCGADVWTTKFPSANVTFEELTALALSEETDNSGILALKNGMACDITLKRTLKAGSYNTFAAPFDIPAATLTAKGIKAKKLTSSTFINGVLTLNFADATSIEAGKPYLVKVNADVTDPTFDGVTVNSTLTATQTASVDFVPTMGKTLVTGSVDNEGNARSVLSLGGGNKLFHPTVVNTPDNEDSYIKGFRAYFQLKDDGIDAHEFNLDFDGNMTGIVSMDNVNVNDNDNWCDLNGRKLIGKPTAKGVYVVNGKKVIVK